MTSTGLARGTGGMATQQMPLIHRIFRHEFRSLRKMVDEVPPIGGKRARSVADHLGFLLDSLHHHHTNEDEMVWPLLLDRVGLDAPLVERMAQQHGQVDVAMADVRSVADQWAALPTATASAALASALGALIETLDAHLDEEENVVVPLIDEHLTRQEWEEMGRKGFEKFAPKERPIAMGQLVEVATPDEAALMLGELPAPIRLLWKVAGKRQYRNYVGRVRGRPLNPALKGLFRSVTALQVRRYQRSDGRRGGRAKGLPVLLMTVAGRRTGIERTTPVAYFEHDGGYLVSGSSGGAPPEPQWFRNLRRADRVTVRVGAETQTVTVRVPQRGERDRLWAEVVLPRAPFFADYERKADRLIPLALLTPVPDAHRGVNAPLTDHLAVDAAVDSSAVDQPSRTGSGMTRRGSRAVAVGAVLGVAWTSSLRGWMVHIAGPDSTFTWLGTFVGLLLPGAVVGALLGWAEHLRRTGGRPGWRRLALAPLLLAVTPLLLPGGLRTLVTTGMGSGAIGIVLFGMLGGFTLSGRGRLWPRLAGGILAFAPVPAAFLAPAFRPELDPGTPAGAWFAANFSALFITLALACAIPLRAVVQREHLAGASASAAGQAPTGLIATMSPVTVQPLAG